MNTGWSLMDNPFDNATKGNFNKMLRISAHTDAALHRSTADATLAAIYADYHPVVTEYGRLYSAWQVELGKRKGAGMQINKQLKTLSAKLMARWSGTIYSFYEKKSPRYKELLPGGTKPFQNGSRETKIAAVSVLAKAIGSDSNLAALKTEVVAFASQLIADNAARAASGSEVKMLSAKTEMQRQAVAAALLLVYARLLVYFIAHSEKLEPFFDLESIRDKRQKTFVRHLKPHTSKTIVKRTLKPDSIIYVKNTSGAPLLLGVCTSKSRSVTAGFTIAPHAQEQITASALGSIEQDKFITVTNNSDEEGGCEVTL